MNFLKYYTKNIVQYDLINKFNCKKLDIIPKLKFIIVQFYFKKYELKNLIISLAALEFITSKKGTITKSKIANISLKIRKGYPVGCKVILKRAKMIQFLEKLINDFTISNKISNLTDENCNIFSFKIKNILTFKELEKNYQFFSQLKGTLNISIGTNTTNYKHLIFLLKSYKIQVLN